MIGQKISSKDAFTTLGKRGQMEMVGFALVVMILIIALLFYLVLSSSNAPEVQRSITEADVYGKALETAMLETTIPDCGYSLSTALRTCIASPDVQCRTFNPRSVCFFAYEAWDEMLVATLGDATSRGARDYRAYILSGPDDDDYLANPQQFLKEPFPATCNSDSDRYAAPLQPIHVLSTAAGSVELRFGIDFCS